MTKLHPLFSLYHITKLLLLTLSFTMLGLGQAVAQGQKINSHQEQVRRWKVESITIQGNQRVEKATVLGYMTIHKGDLFAPELVDSSIKKLFNTGFFSNVYIEPQNHSLVVRLEENPIINQIAFEGNKKLKNKELEKLITLKPRVIFSKSTLQTDLNYLNQVYHKMGRFAASIVPKIIKLPENRINLIFEINEGSRTPIKRIFFVGNKRFTDQKLSSVISTKESKWYRFFSSDDNYDIDRFDYDKELLRRFYHASGYPEFKIISANAELSPERDAFLLTFSVEEGEKYNFGTINVESAIEGINQEELTKEIVTKENEVYSYDEIEDSIDAMTKHLNNKGFAFVNIEPILDEDNKLHLVNIKYKIEEGRRAYLNRINIKGNSRTVDQVIRREFRLAEGDPYNASMVNRSEQRIKNLDYFEKVQFTPRLTNQPDKIDLDVEVEEKSTAKVNFGVGYSTAEKSVIGQTSITEENLFGKGQKLNLGLMRAEKRFDIDLSFTEPYFLGKELSAGFDVFRTTTDSRKNFTPFDSKTIGFSPNIGYDISEYLRHMLRYGFKKEKISIHGDISNISHYIKEQAGINTVSSIGQTFFYDRTDNRLETTKGFFIKLDQEFTGLGGNTKFLKHQINGSYYIPLSRNNESWVLKLSANAGHILPYGKQKEVRINERFFVGDTGLHGLRGFDSGGIGPRLKTDPNKSRGRGDPIGGNVYYTATTELAFPLGLPKELDMSGSLFTDIGSLFSFSKAHTLKSGEKIDVWHDRSLRMAAGVGLLWKTRMGTIRFDFAQPILKRKYDRTKYFHFNLSTNF